MTAQLGYAQLALDGDVGYSTPAANGEATDLAIRQDIQSAFGLGEDQGTPYGRLQLDTGVLVWSVSGFMFEEEGRGTLAANFGENLTAGTEVYTDFALNNAKAALAFEIGLGPVSISPGIAANFIDLSMAAEDSIGIVREEVELAAPIPLGFLRAELDLGIVALVAEAGYMSVDVEDVEASMLDLEALLAVRPLDWLDLFVGYRSIAIEAEGLIDEDEVDLDLTLSGFVIGGGVRF
ncbi:MAG: hypothetical protein FJ265_08705 [Planctomycetes bacterium]|nr:hypothetical protein [Planctomycetota bacterium]